MGAQWANIGNFFIYLVISFPLLGLGIFLFIRTTPYKEFKMIAEGADMDDRQKSLAAQAVAFDLGGKILGISLVLASAIYHSVNPLELIIWGIIGAVFQVIVYHSFGRINSFSFINEIPKGNVAVGIFSAFLSVAAGLILAALISY